MHFQVSFLIISVFVSVGCFQETQIPDALQIFLDTLADSQPDLLWIDKTVKKLREVKKDDIIKRDLLHLPEETDFVSYDDSLEDDDDESRLSFIETGDQWYEKFRSKECEASKRKEYCHMKNEDKKKYDTIQETTHFEKVLEPKTIPRIPNPAIPVYNEDFEENDEFEEKSPSNKRENDDLETPFRNTLIEAANSEKLSKNEQELASQALPRQVSVGFQDKRSINPSNEIKLKISNRFINKGMGPSLPSFGYGDGSSIIYHSSKTKLKEKSDTEAIDDGYVFPYKQHEIPNYNLFKRHDMESQEGAKEDYSDDDIQLEHEYDEQTQNRIQNYGNRHLLTVSKDFEMYQNDHHHHKSSGRSKYPENEFNYEKLAKEIHVFGPEITDAHIKYGSKWTKGHVGVEPHEDIEMSQKSQHSDRDPPTHVCTKAPHLNNPFKDFNDKTTKEDQFKQSDVPSGPHKSMIEGSSDKNESIPLVNVKVEVNPNNLTGMLNTTIARIEIGTGKSKRFVNKRLRRGKGHEDSIIPAMRNLIENVHKSIDEDPELKQWISPHLMSKYDALYGDSASYKNIKNEIKESPTRVKTLNELSNKIERLIQNEVQTRLCAELPPEMEAYYEQMMSVNRDSERGRRDESWNVRRVRDVVDLDQISSKYETVQNLLRQFHALPVTEQNQLQSIKEMLDRHVSLLDELKENLNEKTIPSNATLSDNKLHRRISDRFERLSKAVTFIRKSNSS